MCAHYYHERGKEEKRTSLEGKKKKKKGFKSAEGKAAKSERNPMFSFCKRKRERDLLESLARPTFLLSFCLSFFISHGTAVRNKRGSAVFSLRETQRKAEILMDRWRVPILVVATQYTETFFPSFIILPLR